MGATVSALAWNYLFIPPHFTLTISDPNDVLMITAFFLVAVSTGALTARIRRDQVILAARGRRSELLFRLLNVMALGRGKKPLREIAEMLRGVLHRDFMVFLSQPGGALAAGWDAGQAFPLWHRDLKAAHWALENRRACGWSTEQFPNADALYVPLVGDIEVVGLLVCRPQGLPSFTAEEEDLLHGACAQLALWLERERLEERSREASRLRESEVLHQTLLSSVSHELRTPLTALLGSAAALQDEEAWSDPGRRQLLLLGLAEGGERLNRVIDNLLDMARLSSGMLSLKYDWQDPAELVTLTVGRLKGALAQHKVELKLQDPLPLVRIDYRLMEHALSNLLLNAAAYSAEGSSITVEAVTHNERLEWSVRDQGPGIDAASIGHVFEKFYRVPGSPTGGLGLGLNIVENLVRAHGGEARVRNVPGAGAEFTLSLPLTAVPPMAEEGAA
jgi:two-component system sensor histidine kinase KdpD